MKSKALKNATMMLAPSRRSLALCLLLLAANLLPKIPILAQGVATIVQTVKPADPVLTWQPPAAIFFGTPVSNSQLDATAATAGTFTYLPVAGTILPPGLNTLSVTFKPENPNFLTGTLTVSINVLPSAARGFSFVLTPVSAAQAPFVLRGGKTAPIHFTIAELLNFDQTVMFTCFNPREDTKCTFTPAVSPLLKQPFDVSLVVQLVPGRVRKEQSSIVQESGGGNPANGSPRRAAILTSSLLAATILGIGLRRRRISQGAGRCWTAMLALTISGLLLGCGSERPLEASQQLLIVATSPYESHSLEIRIAFK